MCVKRESIAGRCITCRHWQVVPDGSAVQDMGKCLFLSGVRRKSYYTKDVYPDVETTGVESTPISAHDGTAIDYETKSWFGCVHYAMGL